MVTVSRRGAQRFLDGHPWIYRSDLAREPALPGGEVVRVLDQRGWFQGHAFYSSKSKIALRLLTREDEPCDRDFFLRRIQRARELREAAFPFVNTYRAVHGESDLVPGLVVDRYEDHLTVQFLAQGTEARRELFASVLQEVFQPKGIIDRSDAKVRLLEGLPQVKGLLSGAAPEGPVAYLEGDVRLEADLLSGQKTGAFLDQRENRAAAARHARGRDVYDAFCHAGAFGILAAREGARSVVGVDVSAEAIAEARKNAALNGVESACQHVQADATKDMDTRHRRRERFGLVLIDPPSFTRSRKHVPQARRALRDLNRRAITLVEPGGVLVSSDCSHHVLEETFLDMLGEAAHEAGRRLKVLELRSQAPDHPVLLAMPESRYLKCVIAQVI